MLNYCCIFFFLYAALCCVCVDAYEYESRRKSKGKTQQLPLSDAAVLIPVLHHAIESFPRYFPLQKNQDVITSNKQHLFNRFLSPQNHPHHVVSPPNDPYYPSQWFLHTTTPWDTQVDAVWTLLISMKEDNQRAVAESKRSITTHNKVSRSSRGNTNKVSENTNTKTTSLRHSHVVSPSLKASPHTFFLKTWRNLSVSPQHTITTVLQKLSTDILSPSRAFYRSFFQSKASFPRNYKMKSRLKAEMTPSLEMDTSRQQMMFHKLLFPKQIMKNSPDQKHEAFENFLHLVTSSTSSDQNNVMKKSNNVLISDEERQFQLRKKAEMKDDSIHDLNGKDIPTVAIIDNGCDLSHIDLKASIWKNDHESDCYDGIDNDDNGYIDDCYGWDFIANEPIRSLQDYNFRYTRNRHNDDVNAHHNASALVENRNAKKIIETPPLDSLDHGTYLASLVGSEADNSNGISGICLGRCRVMCLRAISVVDHDSDRPPSHTLESYRIQKEDNNNNNYSGFESSSHEESLPHRNEKQIIKALRYAEKMGVNIATNSYGCRGNSFTNLDHEIARLNSQNEKGFLFVAAAGNDGVDLDIHCQKKNELSSEKTLHVASTEEFDKDDVSTPPFFPAAFGGRDGVLVVGASDREGHRVSFSNYGKRTVDIFAPGILIAVATSGGGYDFVSGTSVSAPIVAGSAALLLSLFPHLSISQIRTLLLESAQPSEALINLCAVDGTLNVWRAIELALQRYQKLRSNQS